MGPYKFHKKNKSCLVSMDHGPWTMDPTDIITVSNTDGEIKEIEQLDVTMARKTFGVMPSPNGDKSAEVDYLLHKIVAWSKIVWNSTLRHEEARCAVEATIGRTIAYSLPAMAVLPEQCKQST